MGEFEPPRMDILDNTFTRTSRETASDLPPTTDRASLPDFGMTASMDLAPSEFKALSADQQDSVLTNLLRARIYNPDTADAVQRRAKIDSKISEFRPDFGSYPISDREKSDFQKIEELINYDITKTEFSSKEEAERRLELIAFRETIGPMGREAINLEEARRETHNPYTFPRPVFKYGDMVVKFERFDRWRLEEAAKGVVAKEELPRVA